MGEPAPLRKPALVIRPLDAPPAHTAIGALVLGHGAGRLCLPRAIWRAWRQRESSQQRGAFGQREDLPRPFRAGHIPGEIKA